MYQLSRSALQAAGLRLDASSLTRLHLTHRGQEIPLEVQTKGEDFTVFFYAEPETTLYSLDDVYWLALGDTAGTRIPSRSVQSPQAGSFAESFPATLRLEEESIYLPEGVGETHWFWQSFTAPATRTLTATLEAVAPGEQKLQIALAGQTTGAHEVQLALGNQPLGQVQWEGHTSQVAEFKTSGLMPSLIFPRTLNS